MERRPWPFAGVEERRRLVSRSLLPGVAGCGAVSSWPELPDELPSEMGLSCGPITWAVFSLLDSPNSRRSLAMVVPRSRTNCVKLTRLASAFLIRA